MSMLKPLKKEIKDLLLRNTESKVIQWYINHDTYDYQTKFNGYRFYVKHQIRHSVANKYVLQIFRNDYYNASIYLTKEEYEVIENNEKETHDKRAYDNLSYILKELRK